MRDEIKLIYLCQLLGGGYNGNGPVEKENQAIRHLNLNNFFQCDFARGIRLEKNIDYLDFLLGRIYDKRT